MAETTTRAGGDGATGTGQVAHVQVTPDEAGQRIDNFLLARLKGVPRSHVYRLVRRGEVRVNGGRIRAHYRLRTGDVIRIPPVRSAQRQRPGIPDAVRQALREAVLYQDPQLLVVNKPAGMAVHAGSETPWGVIEALRAAFGEGAYLELAHRLDRGTSGCLVLARSRRGLRQLHRAIVSPDSTKRYLALVCGAWPAQVKRVDAPLMRNVARGGERLVSVHPEGRPAATRFRVLERYAGATLLEAELETGRTHQIRVHATQAGCPVAGDPRYGDADCNRCLRALGLRRPFLHAHAISLRLGAREVDVEAPLPPELRAVLDGLRRAGDTPASGASG